MPDPSWFEVLKTAITTIARYETSHPPRGEVLLRLANIALDHGESDLAAQFRFLYLDEVLDNLGFNLIVDKSGSKPKGYLVIKLEGQDQIDHAVELLRKRRGPTKEDALRDQLDEVIFGTKAKK